MAWRTLMILASLCVVSACASSGTADNTQVAAAAPQATTAMPASNASSETQGSEDVIEAHKSEAPSESFAVNNDEEIVCRRERITGSNISKKVCRKASDMAARAADDQAALRQIRSQRAGGAGINGN